MSDVTYEQDKIKDKQPDDNLNNLIVGVMMSVVFGEVVWFNLKYVSGGNLPCLDITLSTPLPYKKFKSGFKYYRNRITVWKDDAEKLAKIIKARNEDKKEGGTFLLVYSNRFGGEKLENGNFSHNLACTRYRVIENPTDFMGEIAINQDPLNIRLGALFNID
jgi:hypothetical protein